MLKGLEVINYELKNLGIAKKTSNVINELITIRLLSHMKKDIIDNEILFDIVKSRMTKSQISEKYGSVVYNELCDKAIYSIGLLGEQSNLNKNLITDICKDTISKSMSSEDVNKILKGLSIKELDATNGILLQSGNIIAEYYRVTDYNIYCSFVDEFSEIRCQVAKEFNKLNNYDPFNNEYASKICPTSNEYIKQKYGDIYYNSAGYPIFDKYAIARIESSELNGLESGSLDIALANRMHHGSQVQIPGYTWHHLEDGKTLILIPTELHQASISGYAHSGGAKLLRDGCFGVRG